MFRIGLVSATFRQLIPAEIIAVGKAAGIEGLMWSGDVHVPPGRPSVAREVARMTADAGLEIESYGSYYRAGEATNEHPFERELAAAVDLGAPRIRVWAGSQESSAVSEGKREATIDDLRRCGEIARQAGVTLAVEFHSHSLTDTAKSAAALMTALQGSGARLYWQPPNGMPREEALLGLKFVLPWVDHVHVFHWLSRGGEQIRLELSEGAEAWQAYFEALTESSSTRWAMLEFVRGDDPAQLVTDARQLRNWLTKTPDPDYRSTSG